MIRLTIGALAAALVIGPSTSSTHAVPLSTASAHAGPPWVSIEHPVNPYDQTTRDAFLLVHAFHHGTAMNFPVTGTAEGLVDGQRKTVDLTFTRTSRTGVYAVKRQWDTNGEWTLVISVSQEANARGVTAVVDLARGGNQVASVRVPTRMQGNIPIPAAVSTAEIERTLRSRATQVAGRR